MIGIRSQYPEKNATFAHRTDDFFNAVVVAVAFEIDKEQVFPGPVSQWPGLYFGQVDLVAREQLKYLQQ